MNKVCMTAAIKKAIEFGKNAHEGQMYGNMPYIVHTQGVAELVAMRGFGEEYIITALLHDVVEDTEYEVHDIRIKFGCNIAEAVDAMTKREGEEYPDYLERVAENKIALTVKYYDVFYNHKIGGRNSKKYREAISFLKNKIDDEK